MRGSILWRYFAGYFPIKLVKTKDLDPNRSYIFGNHPHGILCAGAFASFGTDALGFKDKFPGLDPHLLTLQGQFWFFGYRELFLGSGACAATKEGMEYLLRYGSIIYWYKTFVFNFYKHRQFFTSMVYFSVNQKDMSQF